MPILAKKSTVQEKPILSSNKGVIIGKNDENSVTVYSSPNSNINPLYKQDLLYDTLVCHLKLNEGSGTTANDSGIHGFNGTMLNTPTWTTTDVGYPVLALDGSNQYISLPVTTLRRFFHKKSFSVSFWMKFDNVDTNTAMFFSVHKASTTSQSLHFGVSGGGYGSDDIFCGFYSDDIRIQDLFGEGNPYNRLQWNLITFTIDREYSGGILKTIYINGDKIISTVTNESSGNNTVLDVDTASAIYIGRNGFSDAWYFEGQLSDFRIFRTCITHDDVISLYKSTYTNYFNKYEINKDSLISHSQKLAFDNTRESLTLPFDKDHLVAFWKMNEGHGTTIIDCVGGYDSTAFNNNATWSASNSDLGYKYVDFDGTDDTVSLPTTVGSDLLHNQSFTISMWVKIDSTTAGVRFLHAREASLATGTALNIGRNASSSSPASVIIMKFYNNELNGVTAITDTNWHHYVFTFDKTTLTQTIFIDGVYDASRTATAALDLNATTQVQLGTNYDSGGDLDGGITEFRIYDIALSRSQVKELYNLSTLNRGLVCHYPLNEGTGSTATNTFPAYNSSSLTATWNNNGLFGRPCLSFDATDDSVSLPSNIAELFHDRSFSICFWARFNVNEGQNGSVIFTVAKAYSQYQNLHIIRMTDTKRIRFGFYSADLDSTQTITDEEWHFYAFTFNNSNKDRYIYIDGLYDSNGTAPASVNVTGATYIRFGIFKDDSPHYLNGDLSDFRVYDIVLSSAQQLDIYNSSTQQYKKNIDIRSSVASQKIISVSTAGFTDPKGKLLSKPLTTAHEAELCRLMFNEKSGSTVFDHSGKGNNATLVNTPTWSIDKWFGNCIYLDGTSEYLTIPSFETEIKARGTFSFSFWVKPQYDTINTGGRCLMSLRDPTVNSANSGIAMFFPDSGSNYLKNEILIRNRDGNNNAYFDMYSGNYKIFTDKWYHFVYTHSESKQTLYLNGELIKQQNVSGYVFNNAFRDPFVIGAESWPDNSSFIYYYIGFLGEFRAYNRVLEPWEVGTLMNERLNQKLNLYEQKIANDIVLKYSLVFQLTGQDSASTGYVYDYSGNLHHATVNSVTYSNSEILVIGSSNSLYFSGTTSYLELDAANNGIVYKGIGGASPRSICFWIKIGNLSTTRYIMRMGHYSTNYAGFDIYIDQADEKLCIDINGATIKFETALSTTVKQHVVIVFDSINRVNTLLKGIQCYINGSRVGIGATTGSPNTEISTNSEANNIKIGNYNDTTYFIGYLDDIRLYNRALNYDEIGLIYNSGSGSYTQVSAYNKSLALFELTEGSGTTAYNSSGNNYNLTLSNTSWDATEPKVGKYALDFNGSTSYGSLESVGSNQDNLIVSAWIKPESIATDDTILCSKAAAGSFADGDLQIKLVSESNTDLAKRHNGSHLDQYLIGHWKMNEGSGNMFYDSSIYKNHAYIYGGGAGWANNIRSVTGLNGYDFDGADDYADIVYPRSSPLRLAFQKEFTIMAWVKNDSNAPEEVIAWSNIGWRFNYRNYGNVNWGFYVSSENSSTSNLSSQTGTWFHLAITYNYSKLYFYQNGSSLIANGLSISQTLSDQDEEIAGAVTYYRNQIHIARGLGSAQNYFDGQMYDFRIYNKVLSADEISTIYNQTFVKIKASIIISSVETAITSSKLLSPYKWHHLAFVYLNNRYMELYINGESEGKKMLTSSQAVNFTNTLTIGARDLNGTRSNYFDGKLCDLRIYKDESVDIASIYSRDHEKVLYLKQYKGQSNQTNAALIDGSTKNTMSGSNLVTESGRISTSTSSNVTTTAWYDKSGNGNTATITGVIKIKEEDGIKYLSGTTATTITWPMNISSSTFTVIHVCRYDPLGSTNRRILDATVMNYLSGFWNGQTRRSYHVGWISSGTNTTDEWLLVIENWGSFSYNSDSLNKWTTSTGTPGTFSTFQYTINNGAYKAGETSDFNIAEFIFYNKVLSTAEVAQMKDYLENKYLSRNRQRRLNTLPVTDSLITHQVLDNNTTGPIGGKLTLMGSSHYYSLASTSYLGSNVHKVFTISGWIKPYSTGNNDIVISKYTTTASEKFYKIECDSSVTPNVLKFTVYAGADYTISTPITPYNWNHFACVCQGSELDIKLYMNGVLLFSKAIGTISNTTNTAINIGTDGTNYFKGELSELAFYETALEEQLIKTQMYKNITNVAMNKIQRNPTYYADLSYGLQVHYTFDKYSGTTVYDETGNAHNCTLVNGAQIVSTGKYGNGVYFDGVNDYVNLPHSDIGKYITGKFTIAFWFKPGNASADSDTNNWSPIFNMGRTNNPQLGAIALVREYNSGTRFKASIIFNDESIYVPENTDWVHVAYSFDFTNKIKKMYINGVKGVDSIYTHVFTEYDRPEFLPTAHGYLGRYSSDYGYGTLSDFRIYDRVLSEAEVSLLYNGSQNIAIEMPLNQSNKIISNMYDLTNSDNTSIPLVEISRDNLRLKYDFEKVSGTTVTSNHLQYHDKNNYTNVDVIGSNKIVTRNSSLSITNGSVVDCEIPGIRKCLSLPNTNDYATTDLESFGGNLTLVKADSWLCSTEPNIKVGDAITFTTDGGGATGFSTNTIYYVTSISDQDEIQEVTEETYSTENTIPHPYDAGTVITDIFVNVIEMTNTSHITGWIYNTSTTQFTKAVAGTSAGNYASTAPASDMLPHTLPTGSGDKFLIFGNSSYQYKMCFNMKLSSYTSVNDTIYGFIIVTANDTNGRDPKELKLYGLNTDVDSESSLASNYFTNNATLLHTTTDLQLDDNVRHKIHYFNFSEGSITATDYDYIFAYIPHTKASADPNRLAQEIQIGRFFLVTDNRVIATTTSDQTVTTTNGYFKLAATPSGTNITATALSSGNWAGRKVTLLQGSNSWSISIWFQINDISATSVIWSNSTSGSWTTNGVALSIDPTLGNEIQVEFNGGSDLYSGYKAEVGKWTHVVITKGTIGLTESIVSIFINGKLYNSENRTVNDIANNPRISLGIQADLSSNPINGKLADFRYYDTILTEYEIEKLYRNQTKVGPVVHYTFTESSGITVYDYGSTGGHLTLNGTVAWSSTHNNIGDYSVYFDGSSTWGQANFDGLLGSGSGTTGYLKPQTIAVWFKKYNQSSGGVLFQFGNYNTEALSLQIDSGYINAVIAGNTVKSTYSTVNTTNTDDATAYGNWIHAVVVILPETNTPEGIRIYVNGEDRTIYSTTKTRVTLQKNDEVDYRFSIGRSNTSAATNYFKGYMDDFRVYNVALTPSEIKQLYINKKSHSVKTI